MSLPPNAPDPAPSPGASPIPSDGVLVQEDRRGRVAVCPLWHPVSVGRDRERVGFAVRGDSTVEPLHAELLAEFDGSIKVRDKSQAGVWVNDVRVQGEAVARPGDRIRLGPRRLMEVIGLLDSHAPRRTMGLLRVPQRVDTYIFLRAIGRGAAGVVYEAYDEARRERCAIKVLVSGGRAHPELLERFKREIRLQATLKDYPGIVSMHTAGTMPDTGELYCVMEFVTGATLRTRLHQGLPRVEGARLMARVARAVQYAHDHGLLHRDLKPANVLVSDEDTVRLTDFGLCKALEEDDGLTQTGVLLGTPSFMAPEQIDDAKHVTTAADVYALGAMLFNVLTRELPFQGANVKEVLDAVAAGAVRRPRDVDPTMDPQLEGIVLKALAHEPDDRHASALELAKELEEWARVAAPPSKVTLRLPGQGPGPSQGQGPGHQTARSERPRQQGQ
ncbi:MAG: FHA domain-containing serine/threonine-protein kinase [Planctomycetota bacterium]